MRMTITLIILVIAIVLFLTEKFSADLVALLVALSLGLSGVLTLEETFSGFSRPAVITVLAIFILAEGLHQAGVTALIGDQLQKIGGKKGSTLLISVMVFGALLSLFMNNIAVAAVLLPAVLAAAERTRVSLSKLLIPLAYATILGGMATLLTSTNIIASGLLVESGLQGYGLLDFAPIGLPVTIVGIVFIYFWGKKKLPDNPAHNAMVPHTDWVDTYKLEERLVRVRLTKGSDLVGKSIANSNLRETYHMNLVAIEHEGRITLNPSPDTHLQQSDILLLEGRIQEMDQETLKTHFVVLLSRDIDEDDLESAGIEVCEVILAPRSTLIGKTLAETLFRDKYGMLVLGIWRAGRPIRSNLSQEKMQFGDALLIQGSKTRLGILSSDPDLIVPRIMDTNHHIDHRKSIFTGVIFFASIILSIIYPQLISLILLLAGLIMILTGIVKMEQAYRAVEWKTIFIIAGMLPMGIAISKTGLAAWVANWLMNAFSALPQYWVVVALFLLAVVLSQVVHGAVVSSMLVPIAITVALSHNMNPRSVVMAIALATSMTFITPLGHPVNILVMAPGGYKFRDYVRVGLPLTILVSVLVLILIPLIWPI